MTRPGQYLKLNEPTGDCMPLDSVFIENFRGVKKAQLDLQGTTLLIGENDSGKSTILDAIDICLGAETSENAIEIWESDFYRSTDDLGERPVIRIELAFSEVPGVAGDDTPGALRLVVQATSEGHGRPIHLQWRVQDGNGASLGAENDRAWLQRVRTLFPAYLLRGLGIGRKGLAAAGSQFAASDALAIEAGSSDELVMEVERYYRQLIADGSLITQQELRRGFKAARELLSRVGDHFSGGGVRIGGFLGELFAPTQDAGREERPFDAFSLRGSGAQRIGLLLFLGAFLEVRGRRLEDGAQPILIIENPEAHLHPLTLSSVQGLLDSLRWQKIVSTHSGQLLAEFPITSLRRLTRRRGMVDVWRLMPGRLDGEELRKIGYHIRARRGDAFFARCWLLVEGETEFWLLPEMARRCGHHLDQEGVICVEFAQCGVTPLIKLAQALGIGWHLLTDGDKAGVYYAEDARELVRQDQEQRHITQLKEADIEHCLWAHGYADVFARVAGRRAGKRGQATSVIRHAVHKTSKPYMALAVIEAMATETSPTVPKPLRRAIEQAVAMARG